MPRYVIVCDDEGDTANLLTFTPFDGAFYPAPGPGAPVCAEVTFVPAPQLGVFDPSMLDPQMLTLMFAGGFFLMVPVWAVCEGIRYLISMVRD